MVPNYFALRAVPIQSSIPSRGSQLPGSRIPFLIVSPPAWRAFSLAWCDILALP
jgi:hypothetical protein